jgi:hypothetical protein
MWADFSEMLARARPRPKWATVRCECVVQTAEHEMAFGGNARRRHDLIVMPASQTGDWKACLEGCLAGQAAGSGGQNDR